MKSRIVLDGLSDDMWKPEHNSKLSKFVSDTMEQLVVVYVDDQRGLTVCSYLPPHTVQQLAYFVREESAIVTADNFHKVVQFGSIHGGHVDGLLRTLHGLYAPTFFEDTTWPDSILKQTKKNKTKHKLNFEVTKEKYNSLEFANFQVGKPMLV